MNNDSKSVTSYHIFKGSILTIIMNYNFVTWMLMWLKHTRLGIILPLNLVYGFFLLGLFFVKTPYLVSLTIHPL